MVSFFFIPFHPFYPKEPWAALQAECISVTSVSNFMQQMCSVCLANHDMPQEIADILDEIGKNLAWVQCLQICDSFERFE